MASGKGQQTPKEGSGSNGNQSGGGDPKVVGPNVQGRKEEYQLVRHLQSALFGGVYEATGLSSGKEFAIKVLHKSELAKAQESSSIEFCEVPLSEIRFAEHMRGHEHVMEPEEHFEDAYCYYVVFELARGGDLLEALKQKPRGFDEAHAQYFIRQAALGLQYLHRRQVAMQDVSLENMLLGVDERTGQFRVKICDPGQAVIFENDQNGEELPVGFRGLVGKSFRPPELHDQAPYKATKVDSWCLGWSTFYLLTAQPLFMSADPAQQDADWLLFRQGDHGALLWKKTQQCSRQALDFIFNLLHIEPQRRMSIHAALQHPWLADPKISPVLAPKELLPESMRSQILEETPKVDKLERGTRSPLLSDQGSTITPMGCSVGSAALRSTEFGVRSNSGDLPTWSSAAGLSQSPYSTPMLRGRSPQRSPRPGQQGLPASSLMTDWRRPKTGRQAGYVVATAHSPPPMANVPNMQGSHGTRPPRAASPQVQRIEMNGRGSASIFRALSPGQLSPQQADGLFQQPFARQSYIQARSPSPSHAPAFQQAASSSGIQGEASEGDERLRGRAWAFRTDSGTDGKVRQGSDGLADPAAAAQGSRARVASPLGAQYSSGFAGPSLAQRAGQAAGWGGRAVQSPARNQGTISWPRAPSPIQQLDIQGRSSFRTSSPGVVAGSRMQESGVAPSWSQAPAFSPRGGAPQGSAVTRTSSPQPVAKPAMAGGFTWSPSPEPCSMRTSPRSYSPGPGLSVNTSARTTGGQSPALRWPK